MTPNTSDRSSLADSAGNGASGEDWASPHAQMRATRLGLLVRFTALACLRPRCARLTCRRSRRCRKLDKIERTLAAEIAKQVGRPDEALDRALVTALRKALKETGKSA